MNKTRCVSSLTALVLLVNCTGATDPAEATLFDNIVNTQEGGVYDQQIAANKAEAAALEANNAQTQSRINSLETQRANNNAALASLRSQVSAVRSEISSARASLAADPAKTAQLAQLEQQVAAVQRDAEAGGDPTVASNELNRIRSAVRLLSS